MVSFKYIRKSENVGKILIGLTIDILKDQKEIAAWLVMNGVDAFETSSDGRTLHEVAASRG